MTDAFVSPTPTNTLLSLLGLGVARYEKVLAGYDLLSYFLTTRTTRDQEISTGVGRSQSLRKEAILAL
jgi:hypothetical protein